MFTENSEKLVGAAAQQTVQRMGEAAANFLAGLSTDQRAKAQLDFADQVERTTWHYTPTPRQGLPFTEMDRQQQRLAQRLIMSGLSREGYNVATTIMGIETLLDAKEGFRSDLWWRDSRLYYVTVFGEPDGQKPWGWRFEGHHISLNFTIVGGQIVSPTPTFFGSNPASSPLMGGQTLRPLAGIEDLARQLMHELSAEQQATALLTTIAPPDIVTLNRPAVVAGSLPAKTPGIDDTLAVASQFRTMERLIQERDITPAELEAVRLNGAKGIAAAQMSASQRQILQALIGDYIHRMPDELAEIEMNKLKEQGMEQIHFAWAGGLERGEGHYYRLQGARFLVEYDNTQNDANHIHSVWRDAQSDFGADLITQHYQTSHHH
ncbi:MAG: DUF3500 domain-containing protein [Caldilineaceae bacterium]|nr:DUF3500 domain-containing protein [Caldilineaceae bacterium]